MSSEPQPGIYRKVATRVWQDAKFRALTPLAPSGAALWLYLLTGEVTTQLPGLVRAGEAALAEALGWPLEELRRCWAEIEAQSMATADWPARLVWIPNAIRYNQPQSPNVVRSWGRPWAEIPECTLKDAARRVLAQQMAERGGAFLAAFKEACPPASRKPSGKASRKPSGKPFGKPSPNQDQEQEQEQEQEETFGAELPPAGGTAAPAPQPASPVVVTIPCVGNGPKTYDVTEELVSKWKPVFPGVDVRGEVLRAAAWADANPARRKTARGCPAFLTRWLAKAQDSGRGNGSLAPARYERVLTRDGGVRLEPVGRGFLEPAAMKIIRKEDL
ncbi:MAG: hypothetical protein HZB56_07875 [Deltaproteobacteria bacterium]|nr:hypothetical protein [Deltaproteobacteria bacterium]